MVAKAANKDKAVAPSLLSCERKINVSDAVFQAGTWNFKFSISEEGQSADGFTPIPVVEKSVRGTVSNRVTARSRLNVEAANLQTVDSASLPRGKDTLLVSFSVRILPGLGQTSSCNDGIYKAGLSRIVEEYQAQHTLSVLALRYAENIANGRFLWRNRIGASDIEVVVTRRTNAVGKTDTWRFNALDYSLKFFNHECRKVRSLAEVFIEGLTSPFGVVIDVNAFVRIGDGQEVFPSQELILRKQSETFRKGKVLYNIDFKGINTVAFHSQKVGNALRTVDTWYPSSTKAYPIPADPFGAVTSEGLAHRDLSSKEDFFTLLDEWVLDGKRPSEGNQHFVMAVLIRGGVFSRGA